MINAINKTYIMSTKTKEVLGIDPSASLIMIIILVYTKLQSRRTWLIDGPVVLEETPFPRVDPLGVADFPNWVRFKTWNLEQAVSWKWWLWRTYRWFYWVAFIQLLPWSLDVAVVSLSISFRTTTYPCTLTRSHGNRPNSQALKLL